MTDSVGFIGLGNMGLPLASNLVRSGERVVGYSKAGLEAFAKAGGIVADSEAGREWDETELKVDALRRSLLPGAAAQAAATTRTASDPASKETKP